MQVVRRVLDGDAAADRVLHPRHVAGHAGQCLVAARHRQEIGEDEAAAPGPGEVLGDEHRLDAPHQRREAGELGGVERLAAGQRQRHAVQRHRVLGADRLEPRQARPALHEVVLGMDLEPQARRATGQGLLVVLGLEADAGGERRCARAGAGSRHAAQVLAESEPVPFGVLIVVHVPAGTFFQALPW
jgi:hypothetical protein